MYIHHTAIFHSSGNLESVRVKSRIVSFSHRVGEVGRIWGNLRGVGRRKGKGKNVIKIYYMKKFIFCGGSFSRQGFNV